MMVEEALRIVSWAHWLWIGVTLLSSALAWWFRGVESAGGVLLASFLLGLTVVYLFTAAQNLRVLARRIAADWRGEEV